MDESREDRDTNSDGRLSRGAAGTIALLVAIFMVSLVVLFASSLRIVDLKKGNGSPPRIPYATQIG